MTKARSNATAEAAKGDLRAGTGTNLSGILAVGSNGDTIVADSSTSTGLRYTAGTVQSNPFLNSSYQVWQRGTSFALTSAAAYVADRWSAFRNGTTGATYSRQVTNDTTNLPNIQYCARVQRDSGNTSAAYIDHLQSFETVNSIPFAGKTVTYSFYARAGANYSATSGALNVYFVTGTGTDQNRASTSYTGEQYPILNQVATLTTTWQRFSFTGTIGTTATEMASLIRFTPTGTAGANDYYEITGNQLDIGSVALPFRTYAGTIQGEFDACLRYFQRINPTSEVFGYCYATNSYVFGFTMPVTPRVIPTGITVIDLANNLVYNQLNSSAVPSAITINSGGTSLNTVSLLATATGTAGNVGRLGLGTSVIQITGCEL